MDLAKQKNDPQNFWLLQESTMVSFCSQTRLCHCTSQYNSLLFRGGSKKKKQTNKQTMIIQRRRFVLLLQVLILATTDLVASQNDTTTTAAAAVVNGTILPEEQPDDELIPECDSNTFHLNPEGQCRPCEDDCHQKECKITSDEYMVFNTSDCSGEPTGIASFEEGEEPTCDTTVYHVNPNGGCKLCPPNCPPECNPDHDKYQVYVASDCDGNGGDNKEESESTDEQQQEPPMTDETVEDDSSSTTTSSTDGGPTTTSGSSSFQRDNLVAFMEILIVSLPILFLYWPFEY